MEQIEISNAALDRMRTGEVALGLVVRLARSGEIARIAKAAGHDFLFIDTQHALFSLETIGHIAQAAIGCGVATLVRVPRHDDPDIAKLLDCGVMGVVVADIANAEEAQRVVETCRFPPRGRRSVQSTYAVTGYRPYPIAELLRELERQTLVACMIETEAGLRNVEAIAAVDGVDVVHIGCTDYLADIGKPGDFDAPELAGAVERLLAACRKHGKFAGLGGDRDLRRVGGYIEQGLRFHTTQTDVTYLIEGAKGRAKALRPPCD